MTDHGNTAPKADALPGCATPRAAEARRFPDDSTQAESAFRGNEVQNTAGTGGNSPEIVPNHPLTTPDAGGWTPGPIMPGVANPSPLLVAYNLRMDAHAFRYHPVYDSEGEPVRLSVNAYRMECGADAIEALVALVAKAASFVEALADNDPDEPIADNGMTVLGALQFQAPALALELRAALSKAHGHG